MVDSRHIFLTQRELQAEDAETRRPLNNRELVRFASSVGLDDLALEHMLAERAHDICALCLSEVDDVDDVTIIVPCCGKKPHRECFVKCSEQTGKCMYCRKFCNAGMRGFPTHGSYVKWLIWRDETNELLSTNPMSAIDVLIDALKSKRADTVKDYAAMQLFDLTVARDADQVIRCTTYSKYMQECSVGKYLLLVIFGDCGGDAKEAAGFLFLRLVQIGMISDVIMIGAIADAVNVHKDRMPKLISYSASDRELYRELYREDKRVLMLATREMLRLPRQLIRVTDEDLLLMRQRMRQRQRATGATIEDLLRDGDI